MNFRRDNVGWKMGINPSEIPALVHLNWTSPSLIPGSMQDRQVTVLTWALQDHIQSSALAMMPVFTHNKGKLHLEETKKSYAELGFARFSLLGPKSTRKMVRVAKEKGISGNVKGDTRQLGEMLVVRKGVAQVFITSK